MLAVFERLRARRYSKYLILTMCLLLVTNVTLGSLLADQSKHTIIDLMQMRMLDISNTAASMIDGDALRDVTPADAGTEEYDSIMRTLTYFQDNIDLEYIYCIRDMGDGTFTFGLDPTVDDPGEFGSPIVYTEALERASKGTPAADDVRYEDAWGKFYSAYSPVFDSRGEVAGIIAVDFDADWFEEQHSKLSYTTAKVAIVTLLVGSAIVFAIISYNERRMGSIHGQLNELATTLLSEMGGESISEDIDMAHEDPATNLASIDDISEQILVMQEELRSQIVQMHGHAYKDALTGVKSKQAYVEMERIFDERMAEGTLPPFAIVVCDVNGLKKVNDTQGHKAGDEYIRRSCRMVCEVFDHSPVYRVGGDEFVAMLTGRDFDNRNALMYELHKLSENHIKTGDAVVSGGIAEYVPETDGCVHEVFERADQMMYEEKALLKSLGAEMRDDGEADSAFVLDEVGAINVRKHILIADDMRTNREILGDLLEEDYNIYYASDGVECLEMLRAHKDEIALVLLDLIMPNMSGREVLTEMQVDEDLRTIPVVVLTVDAEAELDSLRIGAMDFIPKPYPDIEIVKARISKCIELCESRDLIRHTQLDKLTELYNIDYFYRYVNRFDQTYRDEYFDALYFDVGGLRELGERHGRHFDDFVLRSIGASIRRLARKTGGIGCRQGGEAFMLYCPHREDYDTLLPRFVDECFVDAEMAGAVRVMIGVYSFAQQVTDVEERFGYAKIAAESLMDEPGRIFRLFDANHL